MYKLLILSALNPVTVTAIDLPTDEALLEAYHAAEYNSIFGIIKANELTYMSQDQFNTRFELLSRANKVNFEAADIKTVKFYFR